MAKSTAAFPQQSRNTIRQNGHDSVPERKPSAGKWRHAFLCLCLCVTALALSLHTSRVNDLFWQIRAGHDIVASGHPAFVDTYSWTRCGHAWVVNEWLSFVILFEVFQWSQGFAGPLIFEEVMALVLVICLYFFLYRSTKSAFTAFVLTLLSTTACTLAFQPRPFMFTYLFLVAAVGTCLQVRQRFLPGWSVWLLVPLFALWANLHQGVTVGVGFIGILALSDMAAAGWFLSRRDVDSSRGHRANAIRFTLLSAACLAATLVTPYGLGLYRMILVTINDREVVSAVSEWKPLQLSVSVYDGCLLLLTALVVAGLMRYRRKVGLGELFFLMLISYEAVVHRRNLPLAVLPGALIAAPCIAPLLREAAARVTRLLDRTGRSPLLKSGASSPLLAGSVVAVAALTYAGITLDSYHLEGDNPLESLAAARYGLDWYPGEACSFIGYQHFPASLHFYNDYDLGGFFILHCPDHPVFVDGRADVYAGPLVDGALSLFETPKNALELPERDKIFLRSYHYDCVFTALPLVAKYYAQQRDWSLVYVHHRAPILDHKRLNAWIFLRHRPDLEDLIVRSRGDWAAHHQGVLPDAGL